MENAAEALKMAAAVLIFVLALSISINSFSEVRQTSQTILNYRDREYETTYVEDNGSTERSVGTETIIPSIYKAYKENYKIIFEIGSIEYLYQKKITEGANKGNYNKINYIDLQKEVLANEEQKQRFIQAILYGVNSFGTQAEAVEKEFKNLGIEFNQQNKDGIFSKIANGKYKESLGIYYQEEVDSGNPSEISENNKTKKRVITYSGI